MLAPAKLNLFLDVKGLRPDGYHELETLFVALEFGDDLEVVTGPEDGVRLVLEGGGEAPDGPENLVVRAAHAWRAAVGARCPWRGVRLRLLKRIPVGGGLGGGSSDAAATLRALQDQAPAQARLAPEELAAVARGLGADVPFFLGGGAAVGRGRGDLIEPLVGAPPVDVVLITPPWGHETAKVFRHVGQRLRPPAPDGLATAVAALRSGRPERIRAAHENALALAAMRAYPAFTRFASEVERALNRPPCLSGSGSTLYDVPDPGEAEAVARRVGHLTSRVVRTRTAP